MKIFYSPDYVLAQHSFDTTRKARWVADALEELRLPGVTLIAPPALDSAALQKVHSADYVEAVRHGTPKYLAQSQGFQWDPGIWKMTRASNGGMVAAALEALRSGRAGTLSSGLHHARREAGEGFCTFNGLALAAVEALDAGAKSVLILDFDAHCGGGTYSLIEDRKGIRQIDVSTNSFDSYRPQGTHRLTVVANGGEYLPAVRAALEAAGEEPVGLCLYNAGMDPFEECNEGGLAGISADVLRERERLVFEWTVQHRVPVAFTLAGGYVRSSEFQENLVDLHVETVRACLR